MDPTRELAEVIERVVQPLGNLRHLPFHVGEFGRHRELRSPELEAERHQSLLGSVVQVPLDPSTGLVGGRHDPDRDAARSARLRSRELAMMLNERSRSPISPGELSGMRVVRSPPARPDVGRGRGAG